MRVSARRHGIAVLLSWAVTGLALAAGPAGAKPDPLSLMPEGTLLYVGWPGARALAETTRDTALGKLLAEPQVARIREAWRAEIWPAIDERIREQGEIESTEDKQAYEAAVDLLLALWRHPVAVGLIEVSMGQEGPGVEAALAVQAGPDAARLADGLERILSNEEMTVEKGPATSGAGLNYSVSLAPTLPLRWGVLGPNFVVTIGAQAAERLSGAEGRKGLADSERFAAAMKAVGGSPSTPVLYIDLRAVIKTLTMFQPLLAGLDVPALAEADGVQKLLDQLGLGKVESLSAAVAPHEGGFKTSIFLHLPGLTPGESPILPGRPLTDADLAVIPKDATWASVARLDLAGVYKTLLDLVETFSPAAGDEIAGAIKSFEDRAGFKIEEDLLAGWQDTWAVFNSPSAGGIWFTGMTLVGEVKPNNKLDAALASIVHQIAREAGAEEQVTLIKEEHRGCKITFVNVSGVPMPFAPAWAQYEGRFIAGLYPQMVRAALNHLMDKGESLAADPDFQRGRRLMPDKPVSLAYVRVSKGIGQVYGLGLPVAQALLAMGQREGIPANVTLIPTLPVLTRHLFGQVSATVVRPDGLLTVSHGALPLAMPNMSGGAAEVPVLAGILLPTLARARGQARLAVSAANLRAIAASCLIYAEANKGELPPDLEVLTEGGSRAYLQPKQLISPRDKSGVEISYVYVEGQRNTDDPRNVVVHEKPEITDGQWINVAFLDGHVQRMSMDSFEEALAQTNDRLLERTEPTKKE